MDLEQIEQELVAINDSYLQLELIEDIPTRIDGFLKVLHRTQQLADPIKSLGPTLELGTYEALYKKYIMDVLRISISLADVYLKRASQKTAGFPDYKDHPLRKAAIGYLETSGKLILAENMGREIRCYLKMVVGTDYRMLFSRYIAQEDSNSIQNAIALASEAIRQYTGAIAVVQGTEAEGFDSVKQCLQIIRLNLTGLMADLKNIADVLLLKAPLNIRQFKVLYKNKAAKRKKPEEFKRFLEIYKEKYQQIIACFSLVNELRKYGIDSPANFNTVNLLAFLEITGFIDSALDEIQQPLQQHETILSQFNKRLCSARGNISAPVTDLFLENYKIWEGSIERRMTELNGFAVDGIDGAKELAIQYRKLQNQLLVFVIPLFLDSYSADKEKYGPWLFEYVQMLKDRITSEVSFWCDCTEEQLTDLEIPFISSIVNLCADLSHFSQKEFVLGEVNWDDKMQQAQILLDNFLPKKTCQIFKERSENDLLFKCVIALVKLFVESCQTLASQIERFNGCGDQEKHRDAFYKLYRTMLDIAKRMINAGFLGGHRSQITLKKKINQCADKIPHDGGGSSSDALNPVVPNSYFFKNSFSDEVLRRSLWKHVCLHLENYYVIDQKINDLEKQKSDMAPSERSEIILELLDGHYGKSRAAIEKMYSQYCEEYASNACWHPFLNAVHLELWKMGGHCHNICNYFSLHYQYEGEDNAISSAASASTISMTAP